MFQRVFQTPVACGTYPRKVILSRTQCTARYAEGWDARLEDLQSKGRLAGRAAVGVPGHLPEHVAEYGAPLLRETDTAGWHSSDGSLVRISQVQISASTL